MLPLLDELQVLARNGLTYAQNPYDRERYARLLELASLYYGDFCISPRKGIFQLRQPRLS